jgi:hypothetical protein
VADYTVPGTHPVAINDRAYMLDYASEQFAYETIPLLNPQLSQSQTQVNESSLNPEGLWRRSQESWHKGAGQTYLDKVDSDAARFRSSLGIDVWEKGEISMLRSVAKNYIGSPGQLLWQFSTLYIADGVNVIRLGDPYTPGPTTVIDINLAEPDELVRSMAQFGIGFLVALGPNGVHATSGTTASTTHYSDLDCDVIANVGGRIMAAKGHEVFNITAGGAAPAALFSHPDTFYWWNSFAEAKGFIYMGGRSLVTDKGYVYKTTIKPDGTALEVPSVAGPLPDGETIYGLYGYLNFILIGTNNGVRFAIPDSDGNLEIGALIETPSPVTCFEGQGPFVWFGWTNYDGTHTGLGRCDLRTIVGGVAPAYATDLMATDQGSVVSIVTDHVNDRRIFAVAGSGVYVETANKVESAEINSGYITYDLPEDKEARFVDVRYRDLRGSDTIYLSSQDGNFQFLRTNTSLDYLNRIDAGNLIGDMHEIKHVFTRSTNDPTTGPILTRHTLKSQVKVDMGAYWYLPLVLASEEVTKANNERHRDVLDEFIYLSNLARAKDTVTLKILESEYSVTVEDVKFSPTHEADDDSAFQGTMIVKVKVSV